ncbi:MAG TPA: PQQ-dependent sugar dehydrogenase, partial [Gemmatimonadaceae bacterium]|nr:PQQ-dependent sugar dehydrogenase [Gemmatimonadaceae bacterium]
MRTAIASLAATAFLGCAAARQNGPAPHSTNALEMPGALRIDTVATGLNTPWAIAFLPDGRMLVTERPGTLRVVDTSGTVSANLYNVPDVYAHQQGGLLDVAVDPGFASNHTIYLSFAEPGPSSTAGTAVVSAQLSADRLLYVKTIYQQTPKVRGGNHFGSRIVFAKDGKLFVTQGERFDYRDQAQNLDSDLGKVV